MNEVISYTIQFLGASAVKSRASFVSSYKYFPTIKHYLFIEVQKELVRSKNFLYILYVR